MHGDVYLDYEANCSFGPFRLPTRARREPLKLKSHDGEYDLWFKFIGNGYMKLGVSRDLVLNGGLVFSFNAPEMFDFAGILRDREREKKERKEMLEKFVPNRRPSPRGSYFGRNHSMGM